MNDSDVIKNASDIAKLSELKGKDQIKKLFFSLWSIFPDGNLSWVVEKIIISSDVRNNLVELGLLHEQKVNDRGKQYSWYTLGGNGINLIIAWETQKQNYRFNLILIFLTAVLAILTTVMLWKLFNP